MFELENKIQNKINFENNFQHILYREKIVRAYQELLDTDYTKIMSWWWEEWDSLLWWIYWGKIYVIGANTWVWKTTFVNQVSNNVSNQWFRVVKYSLEDRMEDLGKEEIFYKINKLRKKDDKKGYMWTDFINGRLNKEDWFKQYLDRACEILIEKNNLIELDKKAEVTIDNLVQLMEQECDNWTKLFVIDHLHYFEMDKDERHDIQIQNVMHRLNEITRRRNVAILLVAHYRKWSNDYEPSYDEFKDGSAIKHVANVIIQITRDRYTDRSTFHITKLRWPIRPQTLETSFDLSTFEYSFTKKKYSHEPQF